MPALFPPKTNPTQAKLDEVKLALGEVPMDEVAYYGSNVDLPTLDQVDSDLLYRSLQLDPAIEEVEKAREEHDEAYAAYHRAWALDLLANKDDRITARKAEADARNVDLKIAKVQAESRLDIAKLVLRARERQLEGARSRGSLVKMQAQLDTAGQVR